MKNLKNKNCLITGAASGIGRSLAIGLAKEGMNLFITDIEMKNLEIVKDEIKKLGVKVFVGKCDISKYEDFQNLSKEVYSKMGDIDLLINNAGISGGGFVETLDLEEWKRVLDVNLWGVIYSIKIFLPRMLEKGSGHIVNTASGAGIVGLPCHLHYVASKFAVVGISEGLYSELSNRGINISVICPSHVKTNIIDKSIIKIPRELDDQDADEKMEAFKGEFWKEYMKNSQTPDQVAKKYIKGIKKNKLYIFDRRILSLAMFLKAVSQRLYKRVLRKQGKEYVEMIEGVLKEIGINEKNQ